MGNFIAQLECEESRTPTSFTAGAHSGVERCHRVSREKKQPREVRLRSDRSDSYHVCESMKQFHINRGPLVGLAAS